MTTGVELYSLIQQHQTAKDILNLYKEDESKQGNIYEKLWDLVIKFGYCDQYPNHLFSHHIGNINHDRYYELKNIKKYLETLKIFSRNEGGSSDITLENKKTKTRVYFSSKYFKREKNLDKYDIEKIIAAVSDQKESYEIVLLVRNASSLKTKILNSQNPIKEKISKILDLNDLEKNYARLHMAIQGVLFNQIDSVFDFRLQPLIHRFHQELTIYKVMEQIKKDEKNFLIAHKPRSGKTFTFGGILLHYQKLFCRLNVLIISAVPNETFGQYLDLFNNYRDFSTWNVKTFRSGSNLIQEKFSNQQPNILIVSKQLLDEYTDDHTALNIRDLNLDFIIFDESHFHGTTEKSREIIQSYSSRNTIKIYVTATYNKPLLVNDIPEKCRSYWDLQDEKLCKMRDIAGLTHKHGKEVKIFLKPDAEQALNVYDHMPELHVLTNMIQPEIVERICVAVKNTPYGFSETCLFSLTDDQANFKYVQEVDDYLQIIAGKSQIVRDDTCIFERIKTISRYHDSRTMNGTLTTQLWFLPYGQGMNIDKVSTCLKTRMEHHKIIKKYYDIMIVNSKREYRTRNLKAEIEKREKKAKENNRGLIILAGNQLVLGISLPMVDTVVLLNSSMSADRIMQMMYRCMTESSRKKIGYVVDMNISRVLNTLLEYPVQTKNLMNPEQKIRYLIENRLINIDEDWFSFRNFSSEKLIEQLINIWNVQPQNAIQNLQRQLSETTLSITDFEQQEIDKFFKITKENFSKIQIKMNEIEKDIPSGVSRRRVDDSQRKTQTHVSFTKDILPCVLPLSCILTLSTPFDEFTKILQHIKHSQYLMNAFKNQIEIWWSEKNIEQCVELIFKISTKYFKENTIISNIIMQFNRTVQNLIDTPDKCLEFIHECLKPKQAEKKTHGEVFTPPELIEEILEQLPPEVWKNPDLKWFDPAGGMGNFLIMVYLRLMKGLESVIPDRDKRKQHILEHQLYMSEINPKNTAVFNGIFGSGEYKLNLYEGDTLELDPKAYWGVEHFDVIVGNPPYNQSGARATGNTIWQKFSKQSIEWLVPDGYLCFIHPNGWRKPNTPRGKFNGLWNLMTRQNRLVYLEIHDTRDGNKMFNCGTRYDWYVLQKSLPCVTHKTRIRDQEGVYWNLDLARYNWLANCKFDWIDQLIANPEQERCRIIQSMSAYDPRKKWVSDQKSQEYCYPVVHSTPITGTRFVWSNRNDNGHYGVSKVIFGDSGIHSVIIDLEGQYAMTQHAMAIQVSDLDEAMQLKQCLESTQFKEILKACNWSSFAIEWNMFSDFKYDFYSCII
jgi:hypothetical protein